MVLTVIAVYVICWLPYWLFQIIRCLAVPDHQGLAVPDH